MKKHMPAIIISCIIIVGILYFFIPKVSYTVIVPADIPEYIDTYLRKDSNELERINAHSFYKAAHRDGWNECLDDYQSGAFPDKQEPMPRSQIGVMTRGQQDGYTQCRTALLKAIEK